ncbi:hypothetical protein [Bradyrhizobium sp. CCBAU 53415]|uniref:hypothetical protein n=1 Tax=Bradyrhizobium sp. CCBAU 53415 TaxID=1325119 RepID=UPI00230514CE|nr:hypothetical protein [Bradyrhizobium sp. CCBAU 53415]MDA9464505.1 hypothetical protein [Bradyrhizobium sp. CCBAU 53415]
MGRLDHLRQQAHVIAINLILIVSGIVAVECLMGDWFRSFVPPDAAIVDRTYVYAQKLYDPPSEVTYTRDKYGLRGVSEALHDIDVVTVGGSTTDERYITEGQTWQDVIRAVDRIHIANAGVDGMTSSGHLIAVAEWLHQIPELAPKYYLHLIGGNDALFSQFSQNYDRSGKDSSFIQKVLNRSALARAYRQIRNLLMSQRSLGVGHFRIDPDGEPKVEVEADRLGGLDRYIKNIYQPNLEKLLKLHGERGEIAIFVSQPVNPELVVSRGEATFISKQILNLSDWALRLRIINRTTKTICEKHPQECRFVDLANELEFAKGDFYDSLHATPTGARKIGTYLAGKLLEFSK